MSHSFPTMVTVHLVVPVTFFEIIWKIVESHNLKERNWNIEITKNYHIESAGTPEY